MKRFLKIVGGLIALVVVVFGAFAAYVAWDGIPTYPTGNVQTKVEITPEKVARGKKYATLLCASCHMDPTTRQLTGKRLADLPAEFGVAYSKNITQDPVKGIGSWTDGELIYLLRTGVTRTGAYTPPYMVKLPHLSDDDLESIVAYLRSDDPQLAPRAVDPPGVSQPSFLTKVLTHTVFKPLPYPAHRIETPPATDKVAYGRYLSSGLGCYACHSADFKTVNEMEPEKSAGFMGGGNPTPDQNGEVVPAANITFDEETGIGRWTEAELARALRAGIRPDGSILVYPMEAHPELTEEDCAALYAYLQSVPKLRNKVEKPVRKVPATADAGQKIYIKYGCTSCHGANGVGVADLRQAAEHYPDDAAIEAWIKNPSATKPETKMPSWDGVIAQDEYPALIAYVKQLGRTK